MSRYLIVGDVHWSANSSLIRTRGKRFTTRLENLINSVNWVEELSIAQNIDKIVYLGDFFDKSELTSEEITALNYIKWNEDIPHKFLVGNHEMGRADLIYSSAHYFAQKGENFQVISNSTIEDDVLYLPYALEDNRRELITYCKGEKKHMIFSHNDIAGMQMGQFISNNGFGIDEFAYCCDTCFNGHLHNGGVVGENIINVGNLTGQNFGEDAEKYAHKVYVIEDDLSLCETFTNPYAFNFYHMDYIDRDVDDINWGFYDSNNAVCSITVNSEEKAKIIKENLEEYPNIIYRTTIKYPEVREGGEETPVINLTNNHLEKFVEFINENIESSTILKEELERLVV